LLLVSFFYMKKGHFYYDSRTWVWSFVVFNIKMSNEVKEIIWSIGLSTLGVVCVYCISPFIATKLNEVSTKVFDQPLNVDVTQKYVFWVMSGICVGNCLYSLLDISSTFFIESLFVNMSLIHDIDLLSTVIKDRNILLGMINDPIIVKNLWQEYENNLVSNQLLAWALHNIEIDNIEQMAITTNLLNDVAFISLMDNMLIGKSWDASMLISGGLIKQISPYYIAHLNEIQNLSNDYLLSVAPSIREYYLLQQLHMNSTHSINLIHSIEQNIGLTDQNEILVRLVEAIKRLGSGANGVSNLELGLRNQWGKIAVDNMYQVYPFFDGSNLLGYSDIGGLTADQILYKSKFVHNILK